MPVAVEVLGAEGGNPGGPIAGPVHAAAFEALGDELFDRPFRQAGSDRVAWRAMRGVVGEGPAWLNIIH